MRNLIRYDEAPETILCTFLHSGIIASVPHTFLTIGDGDYCAIHPITPGDSPWATGGSCRLFRDECVALFLSVGCTAANVKPDGAPVLVPPGEPMLGERKT
ncbi:hypothetical protein Q5P01_009361 [Channa striata]|uniref:Uncharacterized protein n=1 Tax=Channa striata TaxID=64152 RepID=A0AA88STJ0_CHASR|nr:hypothetical protein Q5P01_009361 [Channa striata]